VRADEFTPRPRAGRIVTMRRRVGLGDTRPDTRLRLDALARFVQDVADEDAATAPVDAGGVWILRRLVLAFDHPPRFRDGLELATWCSGVGARWAERRTDVTRDGTHDVAVRSAAIWAHVDRASGRPSPLPAEFGEVWGPTAAGRRVSARLAHGAPPAGARRERWPLRATDVDIVGHVNNAAYWAAVEELLARRGDLRPARAEIEFRAGVLPDERVDLLSDEGDDVLRCWFEVAGEVRASALVGSGA
jgi:acyl-ACP thioesterase